MTSLPLHEEEEGGRGRRLGHAPTQMPTVQLKILVRLIRPRSGESNGEAKPGGRVEARCVVVVEAQPRQASMRASSKSGELTNLPPTPDSQRLDGHSPCSQESMFTSTSRRISFECRLEKDLI